jgi:hypothetical protein
MLFNLLTTVLTFLFFWGGIKGRATLVKHKDPLQGSVGRLCAYKGGTRRLG